MPRPSVDLPAGISASNAVAGSYAVCTVVSKNYIASARTLAESVRHFHPEMPFFVLLVDEPDDTVNAQSEAFTLIAVQDLPLKNTAHLLFKYDILELNTAVKPAFFSYITEQYNLRKLIYFDPDIYAFGSLTPIFEALQTANAVLTPHITARVDDHSLPGEIDFLRVIKAAWAFKLYCQ